jgi:hypothetical protein
MDENLKKHTDKDGTIIYELNGKLHREDGPAVEHSNGNKCWYIDDRLHRADGPAIEWVNGYKEWWLEGIEYTEEEFNNKIKEYK